MIVMECNGNNRLFPLTFAITEGENIDSYGWSWHVLNKE